MPTARRCSADGGVCGAGRIVKALPDMPRIEYRLPVAFRRESPFRGRRLRLDEALFERFAMSRVGNQFALHVAPRIDKVLIPRTNGRLSVSGFDRAGLVTSTGAKSGQPRTHPLMLIDDSDGLLAIGSNYGRAKHPAWSANLLAHPECTVEFRGSPARYRAELLTGDARAAAWATAVDFYAGYASYRASCAPREIRVFRLRPVAA
jgi:deazaflavin-dependent oxidoreductase (nitroreductase family)